MVRSAALIAGALSIAPRSTAVADPLRDQMRQWLDRAIETSADRAALGQLRARCDAETRSTGKPDDAKANTSRAAEVALQTALDKKTPYERRFGREVGLLVDQLGFMPHRPNLVLPVAYGDGFLRNDPSAKPYEIQFQVSLKLPFTRGVFVCPNEAISAGLELALVSVWLRASVQWQGKRYVAKLEPVVHPV